MTSSGREDDPVQDRSTTAYVDRYPGARSFDDSEADANLFFGRESEISELVNKILGTSLLTLFGHSGLGKTSLLQAGAFPELRQRHFLPLKVRLNRTDVNAIKLLMDAVADSCATQKIDYAPGEGTGWWEFFKTSVFWRRDEWLTPVLVLDQFEEIFTLRNSTDRQELSYA